MKNINLSAHHLASQLAPVSEFVLSTYTAVNRTLADAGRDDACSTHDCFSCAVSDVRQKAGRVTKMASKLPDLINGFLNAAKKDQIDLSNVNAGRLLHEHMVKKPEDRAWLSGHLRSYGLDPMLMDGFYHRLIEVDADLSKLAPISNDSNVEKVLQELAAVAAKGAERVDRYVRDELLNAGTADQSLATLKSINLVSNPEINFKCEWIEDEDAQWVCTIIVVIIIIIALVVAIVKWIGQIIDSAREDNRIRDEIGSMSCEQITALRDDQLVQRIRGMLDGYTGDDDERSILKILGCLEHDCDRFRAVVEASGRSWLLDDFHGNEWDRLMILLQRCAVVNFADWDDDATRRFINESSCYALGMLTLEEVRSLVRNMFSGTTGDDDEQAINRLIGCLPCSRRRELLELPGVRYGNFDNEMHGDEWDEFKRLVRC